MKKTLEKATVIAFGDLETGGLNGRLENGALGMEYYPIMEAAFIVTDGNLNPIGEPLRIVIHHDEETISKCSEWALNCHKESGLLDEVRASTISLEQAEVMIIDYFKSLGVEKYDRKTKEGAIFAGNSIMFDRSYIMCQMPTLNDYMHYRQIDISAIAMAARFWNPDLEKSVKKEYKHEALSDIQESIEELKVYKGFLSNEYERES
ncbi:oligoribonuclease [Vibrio phage douglas 12A4]|uniref:oligoribonuclease n=1 Tax=Vibrio phage douglas 12A4 TaxID=573171 RepID=UPI0002C06F90|nr:oligoribonuclease [Vibrio phage douglas 12A4]AGG58072.1 oligoribonuclease [Vibrio phage douglas 12A4]